MALAPCFALKGSPTQGRPIEGLDLFGPTLQVAPLTCVPDLEIDPPLVGVQLDLDDLPQRLQPKGCSEKGFDLKTHCNVWNAEESGVEPPITPTGNLSSSTVFVGFYHHNVAGLRPLTPLITSTA